jgi:hypothetical protein
MLQGLIIKALDTRFSPENQERLRDGTISGTRSWLVNALGKIAAPRSEAETRITKHLIGDYEPDHWVRYWALEGLIAGGNSGVARIATRLIDKTNDRLVSMLAHAYLAAHGDPETARASLKIIENKLEHTEYKWHVLRALRIVPLPSTVDALCKIVEKHDYTDEAFDAIMALAQVPASWRNSGRCVAALSSFIVFMRPKSWMDGMRTAAIVGLGNLGKEDSILLLLTELTDENPAIVREAIRSIDRILGTQGAVARVVEATSRQGLTGVEPFARALRWLDRKTVVEELEKLMGSGPPGQQELSRSLLSEVGGAIAFEKLRVRTASMKQFADVLSRDEDRVSVLFEKSVEEARRGFHVATSMDMAVFAVGLLLIVASAAAALWKGNLASWAGIGAVGGSGVLGVVYGLLIANPRRQVRESVDHLMRVKIVFLAYLRQLHQADQAYTRRVLDDAPITAEQLKAYSDIVGAVMDVTSRALADLAAKAPDARSEKGIVTGSAAAAKGTGAKQKAIK